MRAKAIAGPWPAGERVMACIGASPYAVQLLRKAYTIAKDANAEWYAVYVSSNSLTELTDKEKLYLSEALNVAEELGAKVMTLLGSDVAAEILKFARENNITRVVVGKPLGSTLREFFKGSPVQKLLHAPAQFELHLVSPVKEKEETAAARPRKMTVKTMDYVSSLGMVAVLTLANFGLVRITEPVALVFIYLIATIFAALRFGTGPSIFASVVGLVAFDFLFTEPRYSFSMYHAHDVVSAIVFLLTALVVGQLVKVTKRQTFTLNLRLERVRLIEQMSKEFLMLPPVEQLIGGLTPYGEEWRNVLSLLRTTVLDDVSHIIIKYVARVIDAPAFILFPGPDGRLRVWARTGDGPDLDPHEMTVAQWAMINGKAAGAGTETLANAKAFFLPMKSEDAVVGLIGVRYEYKNLLLDQRRMLGAIASLSALGAFRWVNA